ncbi:hypothetical protein BT63DRAFT_456394 [Microthyrium microscopicum]|uniref:Uncharacterized protein n=1 Tax=Microthyrium microscopicum TaxID=703497 RepID=A0A6A6UBP0_9PEZI|nr:hypothetical protein BT63DRAFT_456394 [Microthyrium microscopicum]
MTTWLAKHKKSELQALAKHVDIKNTDGLLKDDLVNAIDEHLRANSSKYSGDKLLAEFYERGGSPAKKSRASASVDAPEPEKAEKKRRKTIVKDAASPDASSSALIPRTPASLQRLASRVRLPNSPALSRAVSNQSTWVSNQYKSLVKQSGIKNKLPTVRQELSTIKVVHLLILIFEAVGLGQAKYPFGKRNLKDLSFGPIVFPTYDYYVPNIWNFRQSETWSASFLWLLTSLIVPGAVSYLINLTYANPRPKTRRTQPARQFDPLVFSIVKGLLAWVIFPLGATFTFGGLFSPATVTNVNAAIYGGYHTMLIGSGIGIITALYDGLSFKS